MRTTTITNDDGQRTGGIGTAIRDGHAARLRPRLRFGLALCIAVLTNSAWAVSVSLTAPSNSVVAAPATITLTAAATPGAGRRIVRVDFFQGISRIGTDTSAPYSVTWSNVPRGNYVLTATAIDSGGSVAVSNPVIIRVDTAPTVSLKSPANNAVFAPGATIPLTASAADADEIVTKVEFFSGGMLLGTQFLAPYSIAWNNVPAGRYALTARATDLVGLTTTSAPVTITVDVPPTVAITSPANNTLFAAPATVTVSATAADADGNVTLVEFFDGATPVGTIPTTPGSPTYNVTLANLAAGTHTLTARATDDQGVMTTSAAVAITVNSNVAQIYYIQTDHLNTPRLIADSAGATVWRWDQGEPFGNDVPNDNPSGLGAFDFPLRFAGQYFDKETELHYNTMRGYHPRIGRYVESDPIGLAGGVNTYVYVLANPLLHTDVEGLTIGGLPSQSPEDLLKKGPGRIGNSLAADFWGKYYGVKCADRCKVSGPTWVRMNAMMICVYEIIPAPVQASPFGGTVVEVCMKTCYEQAPKICGPNACLPDVSDFL
jgi:RHS repeat-associated protein